MKRFLFLMVIFFTAITIFGCAEMAQETALRQANVTSEAAVARVNLEVEEQNFQVFRRVVFYNVITGDYILQIEAYMAIVVDADGDLVVTVKTDSGKYLKHYFGIADNVTYFSEALEANDVSTRQYKVIFKPSVIVPSFEIK